MQRDQRIEWVKLIAILAVIFQHSVHASELAWLVTLTHGAVPAFALISTYFAVTGGLRTQSPVDTIWRRAVQLYSLFLVWNLIYLATRSIAKSQGVKSSLSELNIDSLLVSGYANAMWFLPFILICNAIGMAIGASVRSAPRLRWSVIAVALSLLLLTSLSPWFASSDAALSVYMLSMARKALPAALIGLIVAIWPLDLAAIRPSVAGTFTCMLGFCAAAVALIAWGRVVYLFETIVGVALVGAAIFGLPASSLPAINPNLSLWLFVTHALFLHTFRKLLVFFQYNWDHLPWLIQLTGYIAVVASALAMYKVLGWLQIRRLLLVQIK